MSCSKNLMLFNPRCTRDRLSTQLWRANSEAPVQRASWSRYRRRRRKHQIQILKFPKSVINFSFHPIPLTTVRTFPACRCDDWFDSARYLLLRLPRCLYYQRRKAKVPPQLDFSATIKAKRRAVGGGRMMHSRRRKHFFFAALPIRVLGLE